MASGPKPIQSKSANIQNSEPATITFNQHLAELENLYTACLEINTQSDVSILLKAIVEQATELLNVPMGGLFLADQRQKTLKLIVEHNIPFSNLGLVLKFGEGLAGKVAQSGEALIIENYADWQGRTEQKIFTGFGRIMGVPLKYGQQIIGVLNVLDEKPGNFSEADIHLLNLFGAQATIAIRNLRLLESERTQRELSDALREVSLALSQSLDVETVLDKLLNQIGRVVPYDCANIMLVEGERCYIVRDRLAQKFDPKIREGISAISFEINATPNLKTIVETGQPLIIPNTGHYPGWIKLAILPFINSWMGAPIIIDNEVVAIIALDKSETDSYHQEDLERLVIFAAHGATALKNARLYAESKSRAKHLALLNELSHKMTGSQTIQDLCAAVVQHLCASFEYSAAAIFTRHPAKEILELQAISGPYKHEYQPGIYQHPLNKGIIGKTALTGKTIIVDANHSHPAFYTPPHLPVSSEIALPLKLSGAIYGVLLVSHSQKPVLDADEIATLSALAEHVSTALEKVRLINETQHRSHQLEVLYKVSQDVTILSSLNTLLRQIVTQAIRLLNRDAGGLTIYHPERNCLEWVVSIGNERVAPGATFAKGEGVAGKVWATGKPVLVDNYATWAGKSPQWPNFTASIAGVPIQWGAEFLGTLNVVDSSLQPFSKADVKLLSQFATQAAIAIKNTRLLDETQKQARQLQETLDAIQDGILLLDSNYRLQIANPAAEAYLGRLGSSKQGDIITHFGDKELAQFINSGKETEIALTDPAPAIFEVSSRVIQTARHTEGWVIVIRDVTQARETQKRAQQQERLAAVGQLAAGIAHDFNNILTGIIGFADLLRLRQDLPDKVKENLEQIFTQGQRAANLVNQILDFTRQSLPHKQTLALDKFLYELITLLERTIPEHIHISTSIEPGVYATQVDPTQLQQVITNLALNARDAMPNGGELHFKLSHHSFNSLDTLPDPDMKPGEWLILSISDTGTGIPQEILSHIFEPFFTTKEVGKGSGLGLAQVYGIIHQHNGHITVESKANIGTTFSIYLPQQATPPTLEPSTAIGKLPAGKGETILLVEDEASVVRVAQDMLTYLEYKVLSAANGKQALEIYRRHQAKIALVLTDLTMPQMGGLDLAEALQKHNPNVKIILLSGYPIDITSHKLNQKGIVQYLQKPLQFNDLAQAVAGALNPVSL